MNAANTPAGLLPAALNLWHLGFTPLPVAPDGTKRPAVNSWRQHQDERPDAQTVVGWFTGRDVDGLGIVCGAASGNLEMLELEGRAVAEGVLARLETAFADHDAAELWQRVAAGYVERTPSGGIHWHYRTPGPAKGNTRLARRPATPDELAANPGDRVKVLIETRGQGGFTVCAPSGGRTHTTGRPWEVITGTAADVPTITDAERDLIHAVCSTLDATPSPAPDLPVTGRPQAAPAAVGDDVRPGDDYNQRTDWADLLAPHGWTLANTRGRVREWTRPGKSPRDGISATTGHAEDADRLFVFSSSTEFAPEVPYSKFGAYAVLEHGGDMQAAARALAAAGYGTPRDPERLTLDGKHPKAPVAAREPSGGPRDAATARRLLAALLADLRGWQHLPDPTHVVASLAAAITRDSNGEPVWLLLVAPPSSGKTETVRMLDDVAAARLDEVTSAGLIGWSRGKTAEPCGVLVRVGNSGLVTFGDLSSLLATSDRGGRDQVFGLLRRAYDGHVTRDVSPPGRTNADGRLEWSGRLTVVACVTGAIDRYTAHADALGPRWVYVRIPERTTADKRNAALLARRGGLAQHRADARRGVAAILAAAPTPEPHELPDAIADAIEDAALVTAWGRANVPRNGYGRRDIEGVPIVEEPMRLVQQLGALAAGVLALGLPDAAAATIARRVALDSMPEARRAVLDALAQARTDGELLNTSAVGRRAGLDRKVARYQLEELAAVGVVEHDRADDDTDELTGAVHWQLAGPDGQLIADVFSAHNTAPNPPPTSADPQPGDQHDRRSLAPLPRPEPHHRTPHPCPRRPPRPHRRPPNPTRTARHPPGAHAMNTTPTPTLDAPTEPALTLDDPAALKAAARIPHTRDCTGPNLNLWQSRRYGLTVACKACRRFIALTPTPARETVLEDAPRNGWARPVDRTPAARMGSAVGAPIVGRYRCPEHPDEPVNARGKGCPRCGTRRRHRGRAVNPTPDRLDELLGHRPRPEQADQ